MGAGGAPERGSARPLRAPGLCCGARSRLETFEPLRNALYNFRVPGGVVPAAKPAAQGAAGDAEWRRPVQPCPAPRPSPTSARGPGEMESLRKAGLGYLPQVTGAGSRSPAPLAAATPGGSRWVRDSPLTYTAVNKAETVTIWGGGGELY